MGVFQDGERGVLLTSKVDTSLRGDTINFYYDIQEVYAERGWKSPAGSEKLVDFAPLITEATEKFIEPAAKFLRDLAYSTDMQPCNWSFSKEAVSRFERGEPLRAQDIIIFDPVS